MSPARGATVVMPPDVAARVASGHPVDLGEWEQAELVAAGVPFLLGNRVAGGPIANTAFDLLEPTEQQQRVGEAAAGLVERGLARPSDAGGTVAPGRRWGSSEATATDGAARAATKQVLPGSPLDLIRAVHADPVFLASWTRGPVWNEEDQPVRPGSLLGVRLSGGGPVAVLEQRTDLATSRYRYALRTVADQVEVLVDMVFVDEPLPEDGPPGAEDADPHFSLAITWFHGRVARQTELVAARPRSQPVGRLAEVRSYGLERRQAYDITADQYRQRLSELLGDACGAA